MEKSCSTHRAATGALSCSRSFAITAKTHNHHSSRLTLPREPAGSGAAVVPCQRLVRPRGAAHSCSRQGGPEPSTTFAPQPKEEPGLLSLGWARREERRRGRDSAAAESEGCWCWERRPPPSLQRHARSSTPVPCCLARGAPHRPLPNQHRRPEARWGFWTQHRCSAQHRGGWVGCHQLEGGHSRAARSGAAPGWCLQMSPPLPVPLAGGPRHGAGASTSASTPGWAPAGHGNLWPALGRVSSLSMGAPSSMTRTHQAGQGEELGAGGPNKPCRARLSAADRPRSSPCPQVTPCPGSVCGTAGAWPRLRAGVHTAGHGGCELLPSLEGPTPRTTQTHIPRNWRCQKWGRPQPYQGSWPHHSHLTPQLEHGQAANPSAPQNLLRLAPGLLLPPLSLPLHGGLDSEDPSRRRRWGPVLCPQQPGAG